MSTANITKTVGNIRYVYDRDMDSQGYTLSVYNAETGQFLTSAQANRRDDGGTIQAAGQALILEAISRLGTLNNPLAAEASTYLSSQGRSDIAELDRKYDALFPPPPATPTIDNTAVPANAAPTGTNTLQGTASDDSGAQPTTPASVATEAAGTSTTPTPILPGGAPPQPGTERADAAGTTSSPTNVGNPPYENETFTRVTEEPITTPGGRPGRRLKNPLGSLASYTYQITLYMVTPPAYEAFVAGGRRNLNLYGEQLATSATTSEQIAVSERDGAFIVAQSGGLGGSDERPPGFKYDYYIDGLTFKQLLSGSGTGSNVSTVEYKFQIIEPYGFSFLTQLRRAKDTLAAAVPGARPGTPAAQPRDPLSQYFVLGIRFFGWDQKGLPVTGSEIFDGNPIDPSAPGNGALFENFYDIVITEFKFKVDGNATVYNITAENAPASATINLRKGMVPQGTTVSGSTVRDYLSGPSGLITKLNKQQQDLVNNNTITKPIVYKINWLGDAEEIAKSSVISPSRTDRAGETSSTAQNTTEVNPETETRTLPNNTSRDFGVANIPIVQAIEQIMIMGRYFEDALAYSFTDSNENNPETAAPNIELSPNKTFTWFYISPEISNIEWDEKITDWAYTITYTIQTYLIPAIDNPFVNTNTPYYGPHKRYDYWYTGQNSEVLKFDLEINRGFFNIVTAASPRTANPSNNANTSGTGGTATTNGTGGTGGTGGDAPASPSLTPTATNTTSPMNSDGSGATLSMETINSVRTTLYDPEAYAKAKVEILGDPDFLMQPSPNLGNAIGRATLGTDKYNRFYSGGGFTVNPNGGQVFIEIDFKEAVDYEAKGVTLDPFPDGGGVTGQGGTLSINDSINFVNYPSSVNDKINGVILQIVSVSSSFKNGSFTQTFDTKNPFLGGDITNFQDSQPQRETPTTSATGDGAATGAPGTRSNSGFRQEQPSAGAAQRAAPRAIVDPVRRISRPVNDPVNRVSRIALPVNDTVNRVSRPPGGEIRLFGPDATS